MPDRSLVETPKLAAPEVPLGSGPALPQAICPAATWKGNWSILPSRGRKSVLLRRGVALAHGDPGRPHLLPPIVLIAMVAAHLLGLSLLSLSLLGAPAPNLKRTSNSSTMTRLL